MSHPWNNAPERTQSPFDRQPPPGQPPSFKTNVNRMKTKKWVAAKQYSYDGDDWGDYDEDDEYGVNQAPPQPAYGKPPVAGEPGRNFTSSHAMAARRPSFDTGDDKRAFSSGTARPLRPSIDTGDLHPGFGPSSAGGIMASPAGMSPSQQQHQQHKAFPDLGEGGQPSGDAPSAEMDPQDRPDFMPSAMPRPLSARNSPAPAPVETFPPRKSSLSQSSPPPIDTNVGTPTRGRAPSNTDPSFSPIRPADIYKRMGEERGRERGSTDSGRPSIDSLSRPAEGATSPSLNKKPSSLHDQPIPESGPVPDIPLTHPTEDVKPLSTRATPDPPRIQTDFSTSPTRKTPSPVKDQIARFEQAHNEERPGAPPRDPSFRPKLPGQWESYSTVRSETPGNANDDLQPARSSLTGPSLTNVRASMRMDTIDSVRSYDSTGSMESGLWSENSTPTKTHQEEKEPDFSPDSPTKTPAHNPLSALAATGTAVGEAIQATLQQQHERPESATERSSSTTPMEKRSIGDVPIRPLPGRMESSTTASTLSTEATPTPTQRDNPLEGSVRLDVDDSIKPPAPLRGSRTPSGNFMSYSGEDRPPMVPQLSTDPAVGDDESDRLRKEIVRSLSPNTSTTDLAGANERGQSRPRDSSVLPAEYDNFLGGHTSPTQTEQEQIMPAALAAVSSHDLNDETTGKPKLKERFSWEEDESDSEPDPIKEPTITTGRPGVTPVATFVGGPSGSFPTDAPPMPGAHSSVPEPLSNIDTTGSPIVSPITPSYPAREGTSSPDDIRALSPQPMVASPPPRMSMEGNQRSARTSQDFSAQRRRSSAVPMTPAQGSMGGAGDSSPGQQGRLLYFREILAMKSASERIDTYNKHRQQFATMDSGLRNWVGHALDKYPDHANLRTLPSAPTPNPPPSGSGRHRHAPSLALFKGSIGGSGKTPTTPNDPNSANPASPSASSQGGMERSTTSAGRRIDTTQMQAKGKDLLHSAGVLSGKGMTGAKGLFAKGRSRFGKGGSEKVDN